MVVSHQEPRAGHFLQLLAGQAEGLTSLSIPRTVLLPTAMEVEQSGCLALWDVVLLAAIAMG